MNNNNKCVNTENIPEKQLTDYLHQSVNYSHNITQQAVDNFINTYNLNVEEEHRYLFINENDNDAKTAFLLNYLKDKCTHHSFSFALRRYIQHHFGSSHPIDTNQYILPLNPKGKDIFKTKNKITSVTLPFVSADMPVSEKEVIAYSEFLSYRYKLKNLSAATPSSFTRWLLEGDMRPQREVLFKLAFALDMNTEDVNYFLTKVCRYAPYNLHDPHEIIYYFCASHPAINDYCFAQQLLEKYEEALLTVSPMERNDISGFTRIILNKIDSDYYNGISVSENELITDFCSYLARNQQYFLKHSQTALNYFKSLLGMILLYLIPLTQQSNHDWNEKPKRLLMPITNDFQDYKMLLFTPAPVHAAVLSQHKNFPNIELENFESALSQMFLSETADYDNRPALELYITGVSDPALLQNSFRINIDILADNIYPFTKKEEHPNEPKMHNASLFHPSIYENGLTGDRIRKILKGDEPVLRNDIIYLCFYIYSEMIDSYEEPIKRLYSFLSNTDAILERCRFLPIYMPNSFDNLIISCMMTEFPYDTLYLSFGESYNLAFLKKEYSQLLGTKNSYISKGAKGILNEYKSFSRKFNDKITNGMKPLSAPNNPVKIFVFINDSSIFYKLSGYQRTVTIIKAQDKYADCFSSLEKRTAFFIATKEKLILQLTALEKDFDIRTCNWLRFETPMPA